MYIHVQHERKESELFNLVVCLLAASFPLYRSPRRVGATFDAMDQMYFHTLQAQIVLLFCQLCLFFQWNGSPLGRDHCNYSLSRFACHYCH